jgi:hypothetical protein
MKRIEIAIFAESGDALAEPQFVEDCAEPPIAIMRAVEDFLEVHDGELLLPVSIRVHPSNSSETC